LYHPETEHGILWNDPDVGIAWPVEEPLLSSKDAGYSRLKDLPPEALPEFEGL
jgi:dTDP-4-dehydrorhamnose 3,5-epimerase